MVEDISHKICSKCSISKPFSDYYFEKGKGRYRSECKKCSIEARNIWRENNPDKSKASRERNKDKINKRISDYRKANPHLRNVYYEKNREKLKALNKASYEKHRDVNLQKRKDWYIQNKESHAIARTKYANENKDKLRLARRKWENDRLATDPNYKLHKSISGRIRFEMKGVAKKNRRTEEIIGCSIEELRDFIQNQFKDGMNWDNWGTKGWHIDHRIPVSWFNLENEGCRKLAFNYKNLQPLWGEDNLKKKNFYADKLAS
jgi:hypothetical protein